MDVRRRRVSLDVILWVCSMYCGTASVVPDGVYNGEGERAGLC